MSKIKMTKALPTDVGEYYNCDGPLDDVEIYSVCEYMGVLNGDCGDGGLIPVKSMGGYWAKVDTRNQFEFED